MIIFDENSKNLEIPAGLGTSTASSDHVRYADTAGNALNLGGLSPEQYLTIEDLVEIEDKLQGIEYEDDKTLVDGVEVAKVALEANAIAKGATRAISFYNYSHLCTMLQNGQYDNLRVGQNLYINQTNIPDLWVMMILPEETTYTYTNDADFLEYIKTDGRIGRYRLAFLETEKVNVSPSVVEGAGGIVSTEGKDVFISATGDDGNVSINAGSASNNAINMYGSAIYLNGFEVPTILGSVAYAGEAGNAEYLYGVHADEYALYNQEDILKNNDVKVFSIHNKIQINVDTEGGDPKSFSKYDENGLVFEEYKGIDDEGEDIWATNMKIGADGSVTTQSGTIADIVATTNGKVNGNGLLNIVKLTQEEYDALENKSDTTLYLVK